MLNLVTLPNSSGRFLRDSGGNAHPTIGGEQDNAMIRLKGPIAHVTRGSSGNPTFPSQSSTYWGNTSDVGGGFIGGVSGNSQSSGVIFDSQRVAPSASEIRPKNLTVNLFLKINNNCD